ncbi:type IV pilus assembly protein PilM [Cellulomonas taurus]|uniref:type IV pilus assembly protein PilM n=1 Tax=Cellulomonas taurus TaxID=2729175 RepID=UPI00145D587D|nr:type IV pilus assembly protein PilM [Cellulomonas taurus]
MAKTRVVGLDLGSRAVRAAEIELSGGRGNAPRLVKFGEEPLDAGAMRDGEVARAGAVTAAVRSLWKRERFSTRSVVLGVGNQRVFVRELNLPAMPLDQLRGSLRYAPVQDLLPVAVEECLLDFHPVSMAGDGTVDGMLIAAPEETVEANTSAVAAAGLTPSRVDLNAFALARSLVHGPLAQEVVGVVDIGSNITDIVVTDQGLLRQYRTLPTGSDDLTHAVQQAMAVSEQQAEQVKRSVGVAPAQNPELVPAQETMRRRIQSLGESIRASFSFYTGSTGRPLNRVLLTGRGSLVPGLGQQLATQLGVPMAFGQTVVGPNAGVAADRQPVLPVAVGLAQGAAA